eukprot:g8081.t1
MTTAEEFKEKGNEHFKRQEFALAVDAYNRAIELNPEDPSRTAAEQLQTARSRRARGAEPECAFWLNRSNAYRQQGRWDLAEADAQQALTLSPGNAKALYGSAMSFRQLHREVLAALVRTQARDPPTAASSRSSSVDSEASEGSPKKPVRALLEEELPSQAEMCKSFTGEKPLFFESELCQLAMTGEAEKMVALLQSGAEVNWKRPKDGNTALHLAAEMGHLEAVQLLLECRADPEIHNHFALSPFALAQHDSAVEKLLAQVTRPLGERSQQIRSYQEEDVEEPIPASTGGRKSSRRTTARPVATGAWSADPATVAPERDFVYYMDRKDWSEEAQIDSGRVQARWQFRDVARWEEEKRKAQLRDEEKLMTERLRQEAFGETPEAEEANEERRLTMEEDELDMADDSEGPLESRDVRRPTQTQWIG